MIFQVSNKIKVMNQSSLKSTSNLLWAYTSFQSFKHAQFLLRVSLEGKIWEEWLHAHDYKRNTLCFNFRIMKPNFNYWKYLWYELTCKMAFIVQYITVNGQNLVKKEKTITQ